LDNIREALTKRSHLLTRDIKRAFELGLAVSEIQKITGISAWYLNELNAIYRQECAIETLELNTENLLELKQAGFSNDTIAKRSSRPPQAIADMLEQFNILPNFQSVDTCAGEFAAETPYFFKSYGTENESFVSKKESVVIIGSGPNRIGQGIEFDYACVHAVKAAQKVGFKAIMINSNPETVSTDFNLANKLYFEPLCAEDVVQILQHEKPLGVFIQFGGQTPLNLAAQIESAGFKILGTSLRSSWRAEDRDAFHHLAEELNFNVPKNTRVRSKSAIADFAFNAFPVIVRPSHVIGGAGMCRLETSDEVKNHLQTLADESFPILVDQFLDNATEFDMDILSDGKEIYTIGIMEHLEKAGVHSGDSTSFYPPRDLAKKYENEMTAIAGRIASELEIKGLLNIQFVIKDDELFVLEINPRCSRTVPFLAKARNFPFIQAATQLALGANLVDLTLSKNEPSGKFFAKVPVFPFAKFKNVNKELGPNMKSIGEVLGSGKTWQAALEMGQKAAK
jgi:carbamoyl-phosphate synthase large subunit